MLLMAMASCPRAHQYHRRDNVLASYTMWTYGYPIEPVCVLRIDLNTEQVK